MVDGISAPSHTAHPTVFDALADRLRNVPTAPWLFWQPGWKWRWYAWQDVGDRVARGVAAMGERADSARFGEPDPVRVAFAEDATPDAVITSLTLQAAGAVAVPIPGTPSTPRVEPLELQRRAVDLGCDFWADVVAPEAPSTEAVPKSSTTADHTLPMLPLPPSLDALRIPDYRAPAVERPGGVWLDGVHCPAQDLLASAEVLGGLLAPDDPSKTAERPILCSGSDLDPRLVQSLTAATVATDTAWVLEPVASAFPAIVRWARPTAVVASAAVLEDLAPTLKPSRRHFRLRTVVVADGAHLSSSAHDRFAGLGVTVHPWPLETAT